MAERIDDTLIKHELAMIVDNTVLYFDEEEAGSLLSHSDFEYLARNYKFVRYLAYDESVTIYGSK
jgi:hypothetical protein